MSIIEVCTAVTDVFALFRMDPPPLPYPRFFWIRTLLACTLSFLRWLWSLFVWWHKIRALRYSVSDSSSAKL